MSVAKDFKPDDTWSEAKKHDYNTSLIVLGLVLFALLASAFLHWRDSLNSPAEPGVQTAEVLAAAVTVKEETPATAAQKKEPVTIQPKAAVPSAKTAEADESPLSFFTFYSELPKRQVPIHSNESSHSLRRLEPAKPKLITSAAPEKQGLNEISLPPPPSQTPSIAPPAPSSQAAVVDNSRAYIIQAGAFNQFSQADKVRARLAGLGLNAYVEAGHIGNLRVHRVRIGPIASKAQAQAVRRKLDGNGIPAITIGPSTN